MDEALAGLVVARRAHEAGCRGELVTLRLLVAPARLDLVAHAGPFLEPGVVVADAILERAADAVHLVDLDPGPRRGREANEQPHRPAIIVGEIQEGGVVFAADHEGISEVCCLRCRWSIVELRRAAPQRPLPRLRGRA